MKQTNSKKIPQGKSEQEEDAAAHLGVSVASDLYFDQTLDYLKALPFALDYFKSSRITEKKEKEALRRSLKKVRLFRFLIGGI